MSIELNIAVVRVAVVGSNSTWSCRQHSKPLDSVLSLNNESARPLQTCTNIPYSKRALAKCSADMSAIQIGSRCRSASLMSSPKSTISAQI
eukprot:125980-Heterocapsa_arctica.AAC.1